MVRGDECGGWDGWDGDSAYFVDMGYDGWDGIDGIGWDRLGSMGWIDDPLG